MATYIDTATWPRRDAFEHYRGFDKPYFNVCTRLDASRLKAAVAHAGGGGLSLAVYFIALRLANALTIHKAQGSQWDTVQVFAPDLWAASQAGRS